MTTIANNTLITVPFVSLIENKIGQAEHQGKVFGMYGGVKYADLKKYLADDSIKYKKIMVTYDSLDKVLPATKRRGKRSLCINVIARCINKKVPTNNQ
jgi:hypothetical protein